MQLTANMGYLYPEPQAGPAPTYLLPVGILGMVGYDWVLLAMRWEHQTQKGQDPTILRVQEKRGSIDLRDHGDVAESTKEKATTQLRTRSQPYSHLEPSSRLHSDP